MIKKVITGKGNLYGTILPMLCEKGLTPFLGHDSLDNAAQTLRGIQPRTVQGYVLDERAGGRDVDGHCLIIFIPRYFGSPESPVWPC